MAVVGKLLGMSSESLSWISSATNLYVSPTGSDTTGDGSSSKPWATLGKAITFLNDYRLNASVVINLAAGAYTEAAATISLYHRDLNIIIITGPDLVSKTMSSIQSTSGSAPSRSIIINLNSVTDISVGDFAIITGATGGTNPNVVMGLHEITDVDAVNNRVTIACSSYYASNASGAVTATVNIIKARLNFNNVTAFSVQYQVSGLFNKLCIVNTGDVGTNYGVQVTLGGCSTLFSSCGISGFYAGIRVANGLQVTASQLHISKCTYGAYVLYGGGLQYTTVDSTIVGCDRGIYAVYNGYVTGAGLGIYGCNSQGVYATVGSFVNVNNGTVSNNVGTALNALHMARIYANSTTLANNGTDANPTINTVGNDNSYIDT